MNVCEVIVGMLAIFIVVQVKKYVVSGQLRYNLTSYSNKNLCSGHLLLATNSKNFSEGTTESLSTDAAFSETHHSGLLHSLGLEDRGAKNDAEEENVVPLLGLFELLKATSLKKFVRNVEGESELKAAEIALAHVNAGALLGKYKLTLYTNDTKCDPGVAVDTFFHAIFSRKVKAPILLGSACSDATASLANIVPYWNMVQVSYGATSPVLQDRKAFPSFFRVVTSDASHNAARLAFIQHFKWHVVTVISQNQKEYSLAVNDLVKMLEHANITCRGTITFGENDFEDQLQKLKNMDTRIIVGSFSPHVAPKIFCKVFHLGMYGSDYAWILPKEKELKWWETAEGPCATGQLRTVLQGALFVEPYLSGEEADAGFSEKELAKALSLHGLPMGQYARESYDAVWVAALALQRSLIATSSSSTITLQQFDHNMSAVSKRIFTEISNLRFTGISGPILFQGANRLGTSAFLQLQGDLLEIVAIYSPVVGTLNVTCARCQSLTWAGGHVPIAQRYLQPQVQTISTVVFVVINISTALAIFLACSILVFNLYFRKLKQIKLSSPSLNNIAVMGCIAVYLGVFLSGIDYATNPAPNLFSALCTAKVYLFAGGFSLAFGSIFAKTYRIHKIFIRSKGGFVKKKYLQDNQLILLVCGLLLIDGSILTIWVVTDPLDRHLRNLTQQVSATDRSVIYLPQVEFCSCSYLHSWLALLYGYKGLLLVMGVYMAWKTRHVKIPALNDSQYIGISVYGVVITSCIVVVVANVVAERPTIAYLTISVLVLTTTTATLGLLFLPKVVLVVFGRREMCDPIMQSVGLKLESNTRRFQTDDVKEKLFRLEVQNRVFQRELLLLAAEARKLEKQVKVTSSSTGSSMSLEMASYQVSQQESPVKSSFSLSHSFVPDRTNAPKFCVTRSSWPSERSENIHLAKVVPFTSDQNLEVESVRPSVLNRIRQLIRNKRAELRQMTEQDTTAIEPRRKFSVTMCLQAQHLRESNNDIIIDLNLPQEVETILCDTEEERNRRRRLLHQSSCPFIMVNLRKGSSPLRDHIEPATSLTVLENTHLEQKISSKSRSSDDASRTKHLERY